MVGTGVFLLFIGFIMVIYGIHMDNSRIKYPKQFDSIASVCLILGFFLFSLGIIVWLWKTMP